MKRTLDNCTIVRTDRLKNGIGETKALNFLEPHEFRGAGRLFGIHMLEPGCSIGIHTHEGDQEIYFILEGKGEYTDDGEIYEVKPNDVLICPDGHSHSIKNIGNITLKYIATILYTVK